jgi:soluble lytic murein transglycosylase
LQWLAALRPAAVLAGALALLGSTPGPAERLEFDGADRALLERPGAALGHAVDAFQAGELARAESLFAALAERYPLVADYADLYRLRLLVLTGRLDQAVAFADAWPHAGSRLRGEAYRALGRVRVEQGDEAGARAAFELALAASREDARRAELLLELARSHLRSQQPEPAGERLLELWVSHPTSPLDPEVERELAAVERTLGRGLRTADRTRRRADVLFDARYNEEALAAYERALAAGGLVPRAALAARRQRAETLFRMRRYPEAAAAFGELPREPESRIQHARAIARAGDPKGAAETLERLARELPASQAERARFLAALLWEGEGETERARRLYAGLASAGAKSGFASAAQWRLAWEAYLGGRFDEAGVHLDILERRGDDEEPLRARYWRLRAAERAGDASAAAGFGELAREFPLSYYGWRASARAALGPTREAPPPLARGTAVLAPREIERPRILLEAGLLEDALAELEALYGRARGLDDRLALAELYADAGEFNRAQRLVVDAYAETLARGPGGGPVELWWHAWPAPFGAEVAEALAPKTHLDPALVYSIMREESGYRPEVRSVTGARGLLQLMPETAQRVAEREALGPIALDDLFVPALNIRLGAAYLEELLELFSGRASAAIGSYNAGPHRVAEWLDGSARDDDEWVEMIPYDQTRGYVKRVLRSVHAYRVLY